MASAKTSHETAFEIEIRPDDEIGSVAIEQTLEIDVEDRWQFQLEGEFTTASIGTEDEERRVALQTVMDFDLPSNGLDVSAGLDGRIRAEPMMSGGQGYQGRTRLRLHAGLPLSGDLVTSVKFGLRGGPVVERGASAPGYTSEARAKLRLALSTTIRLDARARFALASDQVDSDPTGSASLELLTAVQLDRGLSTSLGVEAETDVINGSPGLVVLMMFGVSYETPSSTRALLKRPPRDFCVLAAGSPSSVVNATSKEPTMSARAFILNQSRIYRPEEKVEASTPSKKAAPSEDCCGPTSTRQGPCCGPTVAPEDACCEPPSQPKSGGGCC